MNLIDKDAIVAEIEKRLDELWDLLPNASDVIKDNYTKEEANITGKYTALESFGKFINTLDVKEVDFETAFAVSVDHFNEKNNYGQWPESDLREFAEHFFELGLNHIKSNKNE